MIPDEPIADPTTTTKQPTARARGITMTPRKTPSHSRRMLVALYSLAAFGCSAEAGAATNAAHAGTTGSGSRAGDEVAGTGVLTTAGSGSARDPAAGSPGEAGTAGTASPPPPPAAGDPQLPGASACRSALPRVQSVEPARAAHGEALLRNMTLAPGVLPEIVVRNLWVAWGVAPPASDQDFWAQARARYGFVEAPYDSGGLPLGMRREGELLAFDCMLCHAGRVASTTVLGAANGGVDLESFFDDLKRLQELASGLGIPSAPVPFDLDGLTLAVGAQDAFGLGFRFAGALAGGVNTRFGPQKAPAWWTFKHKTRIYSDGAGDASGHHSMMATLVAFGVTPDQLIARDQDFLDIAHYIRSIESPCWTLSPLAADKLARGRQVFANTCARCHGVYEGSEAKYPNMIVPLEEIGTDPVRAQRFGQAEAARLNASWFGDPPFEPTFSYLAPPLVGIWARAPYFHNGSVPTLLGVIDPSQRPARWRRLGSEVADFDVDRVGLRYDEPSEALDPDTLQGRRVYDTTREGMSNAGHLYGAPLTAAERADLLEYLRSL